jgi:hypothetical protein
MAAGHWGLGRARTRRVDFACPVIYREAEGGCVGYTVHIMKERGERRARDEPLSVSREMSETLSSRSPRDPCSFMLMRHGSWDMHMARGRACPLRGRARIAHTIFFLQRTRGGAGASANCKRTFVTMVLRACATATMYQDPSANPSRCRLSAKGSDGQRETPLNCPSSELTGLQA